MSPASTGIRGKLYIGLARQTVVIEPCLSQEHTGLGNYPTKSRSLKNYQPRKLLCPEIGIRRAIRVSQNFPYTKPACPRLNVAVSFVWEYR